MTLLCREIVVRTRGGLEWRKIHEFMNKIPNLSYDEDGGRLTDPNSYSNPHHYPIQYPKR